MASLIDKYINYMWDNMTGKTLAIICILMSVPVFSDNRVSMGAAASMFDRFTSHSGNPSSEYSILTTAGEQLALSAEDYYFDKGNLSMSGTAREIENSEFIMKGTRYNMYGWVVLRDRKTAYEYTTDERGNLLAEEVPVEKIFPVCNIQSPSGSSEFYEEPEMPSYPRIAPHIGDYDGENLNTLQSIPGAELVLWLDIRDVMDGDEPRSQSKEDVWHTWQSMAANVSIFNVNVTTDKSVYDATATSNRGFAEFTNQTGRSSCCMNCFATSRGCWVYRERNGYGTGRITAHEVGHLMGLSHDGGSPGGEYFNGLPSFRWTPLMGNVWPGDNWGEEALYHHSNGQYSSANNQQDDLDIINDLFEYKPDDIETSVPIVYTGATTVEIENNWGHINRNTDSDDFDFQIGSTGGNVQLRIDRIEYIGGSLLDVQAEIKNSSGTVVAESNVSAARYAEFDLDLNAGNYTLTISGGAEGTPSNGFSKYSSLGYYGIQGEIQGAVNNQINSQVSFTGSENLCGGEALVLNAHANAEYTYQWYNGATPIAGATTSTLTVTQTGSYTVQIIRGEEQSISRPVDVTVAGVIPAPYINSVTQCGAGAGEVILRAAGSAGSLNWYATATSQDILFTGPHYTTSVPVGTSFFVEQSTEPPKFFTGPADNSIGGGGFHGGDYYTVFDAHKELVIKSVLVYADGSRVRRFVLKTSGGTTIESRDVSVPDGQSRVTLDFTVPAGSNYRLGIDRIGGQDVDMYRSSSGLDYPYTVPDLISITQSTAGGADSYNYLYYVYNWEVQAAGGGLCTGPRAEVVVGACVDVGRPVLGTAFDVYLGVNNSIRLNLPAEQKATDITLYSSDGSVHYYSPLSVNVIDASNLTAGKYFLKLKLDGVTLTGDITLK